MFTVCPKCGLMLVVTATDLRAAQGHVRCGRCRSVFNALDSLSETTPQEAPLSETPTPEQTSTEEACSPEAPSFSPSDVTTDEAQPEPELPEAQAAEDFSIGFEAFAPEQDSQVPPRADAPQGDGRVVQSAEPPPEEAEAATQGEPEHAPDGQDEPAELEELETAREAHTGRWLVGTLLFALVLAGQLINHYRGTLAAMPSFGPAVRAVYGVLGIPVVPLWNVRAYEARQLGATVSGSNPHQITVRASIANRGHWPLPLPLLRVTLQDRYGRTIAARDVPPRDYLLPSRPAPAMLPAGGRIDATVAFVNPGPQAIGFEIDACLREGAAVECAHGGPH